MAKKILTCLFICMFVFIFALVPLAVSGEYLGIIKIKGKGVGWNYGKQKIKEKYAIVIDINDATGSIVGVMGDDEETLALIGQTGDQAFFVEAESSVKSIIAAGKVKAKKNGKKLKLKGIFVGKKLEKGEESVISGKISAKLVLAY